MPEPEPTKPIEQHQVETESFHNKHAAPKLDPKDFLPNNYHMSGKGKSNSIFVMPSAGRRTPSKKE